MIIQYDKLYYYSFFIHKYFVWRYMPNSRLNTKFILTNDFERRILKTVQIDPMNEIVNMKFEKSLQAGRRRTPRDQKKA